MRLAIASGEFIRVMDDQQKPMYYMLHHRATVQKMHPDQDPPVVKGYVVFESRPDGHMPPWSPHFFGSPHDAECHVKARKAEHELYASALEDSPEPADLEPPRPAQRIEPEA